MFEAASTVLVAVVVTPKPVPLLGAAGTKVVAEDAASFEAESPTPQPDNAHVALATTPFRAHRRETKSIAKSSLVSKNHPLLDHQAAVALHGKTDGFKSRSQRETKGRVKYERDVGQSMNQLDHPKGQRRIQMYRKRA
jgi:hypothetical protein